MIDKKKLDDLAKKYEPKNIYSMLVHAKIKEGLANWQHIIDQIQNKD